MLINLFICLFVFVSLAIGHVTRWGKVLIFSAFFLIVFFFTDTTFTLVRLSQFTIVGIKWGEYWKYKNLKITHMQQISLATTFVDAALIHPCGVTLFKTAVISRSFILTGQSRIGFKVIYKVKYSRSSQQSWQLCSASIHRHTMRQFL
jgi:hypothetical protein